RRFPTAQGLRVPRKEGVRHLREDAGAAPALPGGAGRAPMREPDEGRDRLAHQVVTGAPADVGDEADATRVVLVRGAVEQTLMLWVVMVHVGYPRRRSTRSRKGAATRTRPCHRHPSASWVGGGTSTSRPASGAWLVKGLVTSFVSL